MNKDIDLVNEKLNQTLNVCAKDNSNKMDEIQNTFMHLTNVAIQKTADNYDEKLGGKWDLRSLKLFLMAKFGSERVNEAFTQI